MNKKLKRISAAITAAVMLMIPTVGIAAEEWSEGAFRLLNGKSILSGTQVTMERGGETITRADFSVILDRLLELEDNYSCVLNDVSDTDYYSGSVRRLITNGIAKGKADGYFNPGDGMTREEMAKLMVSAYEFKKGSRILYDDVLAEYTDKDEISPWAAECVNKAIFSGLMKGVGGGRFDGGSAVTKAQAVQCAANLIMNLYELKPNISQNGETTIEQTVRGNSFYEDEPVRFIIHTNQKSLLYEVKDFWRRTIYSGYKEPENGVVDLTLDMNELGYFELSLFGDDRNGNTVTLLTNSFSRVTRRDFQDVDPADSYFGVVTALRKNPTDVLEDALNREVRMLGVKSIRDGSEWKSVERTKNVYTPQLNDEVIEQMAKKYNMDFLYTGGLDNPLYDVNEKTGAAQTPYTDNGREGYANFMKWLALFDGGFYKYLNLYNEWNGRGFGARGNSPADCKPEMYHALAKKTYETVKSASRSTVLVGPSFAGGGFEAGAEFMEELGKLGTLQYLDIVSGNAYNVTTTPDFIAERFSNIDRIIKQYNNGKEKDIWITETGYPTYGDITESMAGEYTIPLMVNAISAGVDRIFWYNLADYGIDPNNKEDHFGLMRYPTNELGAHTLKPSFLALAVLTREITEFKYGENRSTENFKHHTFTKGDEIKNILWAYSKQNVEVRTDTALKITDFMGNSFTAEPENGRLMLTLENDPIFIDGYISEVKIAEDFDIRSYDTSVNSDIKTDVSIGNINCNKICLEIDGKRYELGVNNGCAEGTITLPQKTEADDYDIIAKVYGDGRLIGEIKDYVKISKLYDVTVIPEITNIKDKEITFNVKLKNNKAEPVSVQGIKWQLGSADGELEVNKKLNAYETAEYKIKTDVDRYTVKYSMNVCAVVDYENKNEPDVSRVAEFNPNAKKTVIPEGDAEEQLQGAPVIDLETGEFVPLNNSVRAGSDDLSGKMWLTWDDDNLYFTAKIRDNIHETPKTGELIWNNDSIQLAVALDADNLGEEFDKLIDMQVQKDPNFSAANRSNYYEFTISDTSEGTTIWTHKDVKTGSVSYKLEGASAVINRDEKSKTTTYYVSFPWSELPPMNPEAAPEMLMSVLVNDCDAGVRKGWIEWGSGIGMSKNRALFRTFQFVKSEE